jgi:chitinase
VQFYNNQQCRLNAFSNGQAQGFNFEKWEQWARTISKNKNVKVLVGVPVSKDAASSGYADVTS